MPTASKYRPHSPRALLAFLTLVSLPSCRHARGNVGQPEAVLSASAQEQARFRALRGAWFSANAEERLALDPELRAFLGRFPQSEPGDMVRVLLAFDSVSRASLPEAHAFLAAVVEQSGSVHDFARVAEAYALLRGNEPNAAWNLLDPLAGKIVDPDERLVFSELRLRAAAAADRFGRALQAAEELLAEAPLEARGSLQATVQELFRQAPKRELAQNLARFELASPNDGAFSSARDWLRKMLREQLVTIAIREKDADLARRLLDSAPAALRSSASGSALAEIAGGGPSVPLILGRSIGVAFALGSSDDRRRSASLAAGLTKGLGLPEAAKKPGGVRLVAHDDAGSTVEALRELAAEGVALLVAGMNEDSAEVAARFADEHEIAVLLVHAPRSPISQFRHAYVLGESSEREQAAIDVELARRNLVRVARVGRGGQDCDSSLINAGGPRFAVEDWRRARVSAVLVLGSAACASEVTRDLRAASFAPWLVLGLEASDYEFAADAPRARFALGAGPFPSVARSPVDENAALPPIDWYEALGHDAALLSERALAEFPDGRVDDGRAVRELHGRAERSLATAEAALWTSDSRRFSEDHLLRRTLTILSPSSTPR